MAPVGLSAAAPGACDACGVVGGVDYEGRGRFMGRRYCVGCWNCWLAALAPTLMASLPGLYGCEGKQRLLDVARIIIAGSIFHLNSNFNMSVKVVDSNMPAMCCTELKLSLIL